MGLFVSWCTVPLMVLYPPPGFNPRVLVCFFFCIIPLVWNFAKHLILNYCHLSIRPDLITDAAVQGGSFVYFRLLEQTVEHNRKIYDLFFLDLL